jgi:uncharacterized oxidoreductase
MVRPEALGELAAGIIEALGTPRDLAAIVSHSLLDANLAGHDSHGVIRLPTYARMARDGSVIPMARPLVVEQRGAVSHVDGGWGWGQPACRLAVEEVARIAARQGIGAVRVGRANHVGRLGEYVEELARGGLGAIALCNGGPDVAPHGGRVAMLGTNPLAFAAPRGNPDAPFLVDFATSAVAEGKVALARSRGESASPGAILDRNGRPSQDPDDFYDGGCLLPFGGHKGYGLSVMIELLAGGLSESGPSCLPGHRPGNGVLVVAFRIAAFTPLDGFVERSERFHGALESTPPAQGYEEVLAPGTPEARSRRERQASGIPIPARTWAAIEALATDLRVERVATE